MAVQKIEVKSEDLIEQVGELFEGQIDDLPFGVIELDLAGTVLRYNRYEEYFAKRKRQDVVGKNFFHDVAPCTKVRKFYGAFQQGVEQRKLNEVFDFTFRFPTGDKGVRIRMTFRESPRVGIWIFVTPIEEFRPPA